MTYRDAINAGYKDGRQAYQRGYVSRRINANHQPVLQSNRNGAYILLPCYHSTQYCIRQYLIKP